MRPELNYEVPLDEAAAVITGTRSCSIDVAWPGVRRGVEYDSLAFHLDPEKDLRRKEALEHMGWTINTIKLDQRQPGGPASEGEVAELHQRLLRATRCGMGLERALFGVPVSHDAVRVHV